MHERRALNLVVRRVSPLSVLKFSLLLYLSLYAVGLVAAMVLWSILSATGARANVESLIGDLFYAGEFRLKGGQLLRATVLGGGVVVLLGAGANVLMTVLYNLISDVVGGVRVTAEESPDEGEATLAVTPPSIARKPRQRAAAKAALRPEVPVALARRRESRGP